MGTWSAEVSTKTGEIISLSRLRTFRVEKPIVVKKEQITCVLLNAKDIIAAARKCEAATKQMNMYEGF